MINTLCEINQILFLAKAGNQLMSVAIVQESSAIVMANIVL